MGVGGGVGVIGIRGEMIEIGEGKGPNGFVVILVSRPAKR